MDERYEYIVTCIHTYPGTSKQSKQSIQFTATTNLSHWLEDADPM
eukprot:SAG31_NODE_41108_length_277_cov_1.415730_1_plen_44_part_01